MSCRPAPGQPLSDSEPLGALRSSEPDAATSSGVGLMQLDELLCGRPKHKLRKAGCFWQMGVELKWWFCCLSKFKAYFPCPI